MRVSVAPLASRPLPVDNKKAPPHQRGSTNLGSCGASKPLKARVPPLAMCKIASILQFPPLRTPPRGNKVKNSPRFSVVRAKTGAVPCFSQLVKAFTLLNTRDFARRCKGYPCQRQDMEANHQPTGKFVSTAPAFPLPSATLADRVSDRERKGRGRTARGTVGVRATAGYGSRARQYLWQSRGRCRARPRTDHGRCSCAWPGCCWAP